MKDKDVELESKHKPRLIIKSYRTSGSYTELLKWLVQQGEKLKKRKEKLAKILDETMKELNPYRKNKDKFNKLNKEEKEKLSEILKFAEKVKKEMCETAKELKTITEKADSINLQRKKQLKQLNEVGNRVKLLKKNSVRNFAEKSVEDFEKKFEESTGLKLQNKQYFRDGKLKEQLVKSYMCNKW